MVVNVSICGLGNTGAEIAFALLQEREIVFHINCMDPSEAIMGNYIDLQHALALSHHTLSLNDRKSFSASEIIFHTAGANIPKGGDRNDVLRLSAEITTTIFENVNFDTEALVIVVANPVEPICNIIHKLQQNKLQICGTGTLLDQFRLNSYISQHSQYNPQDIQTLVIGEHGSHMVPIWSQSFVKGEKLQQYFSKAALENFVKETKNAARSIKHYNKHTKFGVSYCAVNLMYAWLNNTISSTVCSTLQDDYYQKISATKYCLSIPVKMGKRKIHPYPLEMSLDEQNSFREAAQKIDLLRQESL